MLFSSLSSLNLNSCVQLVAGEMEDRCEVFLEFILSSSDTLIATDFSFQTIESFAAQEKQMEVCEVCGAFLIVGDAQSRVDDHLMGKQHMGYAKIKATVEELKVSFSLAYII